MGYKENATASIGRNNLKLTADKVIQILDQVREEGKKSRRRWIWELMQNAKDVPNMFSRVSVHIELSENQLVFKHNGDPFRVENITGIIQQVSTKPSNSSESATTGKFGTGFIATHLLSDKVIISGIVQEVSEDAKRFQFELDRSGKTSEELMIPIGQALELISEIDDNSKFPPVHNYAALRKESDLENSFLYPLSNLDSVSAAREGVEDLKVTLPLTLAFLQKIKQVRVINNFQNEDLTYTCETERGDEGFSVVVINIQNNLLGKSNREYYIIYSEGDTSLAAQVSDLTSYELKIKSTHQPFLYRDFPLIGTENFYLPFILNSKRLFPTEKRDGILLNGSAEKPLRNKDALLKGFECATKLVDALIKLKAKNLFIASLSRLPKFEFEEDTKEWYINTVQKPYRTAITDRKLVESPNPRNLTLAESVFPKSNTHELNETFWELCAPFLDMAVPDKEKLNEWLYHIGPESETDTWDYQLYYELDDLLAEIEKKKEVEGIMLTQRKPNEVYSWLNGVYEFTIARGQVELLGKYAVIPNQYGKLKKLNELFFEQNNIKIPDQFLDILATLGKDWKDEIINREIRLSIESHQARDVAMISTSINEILLEERKALAIKEKIFLKRKDALTVLIAILRIDSVDSTKNSFRHKLFTFAKGLFHFEDDFVQIDNIGQFKFDHAVKLMISIINTAISNAIDIPGLSQFLRKSEEQTITWLDSYLRLLENNAEFKHFLEEGNIVPNRIGTLRGYKDLFNYGTADQALDDSLLLILQELEKSKNWYPLLIADGIGIPLPHTKTFEQLGKAIHECIVKIKGTESHEEYSKPILDLINWVTANETLALSYLPFFVNLKTEFFFKVTVGNDEAANKNIFTILKNKENLAILAELSSNGTDLAALQKLNSISKEVGFEKIIESAEELLEERRDFEFKKQIGHNVEELLKELLSADLPNYQAQFVGKGPYDFVVKAITNGKEYYIELKSVKEPNKDPIRMAISQARYALKYPDRYALCVIKRPEDSAELPKNYLSQNIKCIYQVGSDVKRAVEESYNVENYIKASNAIKLEIRDPEMKVLFDLEYIEKLGKSFESLKEKIITQLG